MARHILTCLKCKQYTMKETCSTCGEATVVSRPPKYSPEDKFGAYRRKAKKLMEEENV